MIEAFDLSGQMAYVWSAYGITLLVLVGNAWAARRQKARALERARRTAPVERPSRRPTVRQVQ